MVSDLIASGNKDDLEKHYVLGWRLHHEIKDNTYYLTSALRCDNKAVLLSKYLTVSEASLLAKGDDGKTNAEVLLSQETVVAMLAKNYSLEYGFEIKSPELINHFLAAEKNATEKSHFELLRAAFGIKKKDEEKKCEDTKKDEGKEDKKEEKKDDAKHEEPKHEEPKHEEPKHEEPKHEEPKNDDAPKEGDRA